MKIKESLTKLKEEKNLLQESVVSIRDAAIEAVMEKEQEISEIKFQYEEFENFHRDQMEISQNTINILEAKLAQLDKEKEYSRSDLFSGKIKELEVGFFI